MEAKKKGTSSKRPREKTTKSKQSSVSSEKREPLIQTHEVVTLGACYLGVLLLAHFLGMIWGVAAAAVSVLVCGKILYRLLKKVLWEQWIRIDKESRDMEILEKGFDWRPLVILGVVAVVLTGNNYFGHRPHFRYFAAKAFAKEQDTKWLRGATLKNAPRHSGVQRVYEKRVGKPLGKWGLIVEFGYWVGWRVLGFFVLPMLLILALPREKLRDYGLRVKGMTEHLWVYGVLFAIVFAAVVVASYTPAFRYHYPFPWARSAPAGGVPLAMLLAWELMYAAQFFSLEFFFRGFMLSSLKRSMGAYAIFAMLVPYTMIHFGKPIPETLGAFAAGLVLGTLALATRSIWCGVLIHISVAVSMDLLALFQKGTLPSSW